MLQQSYDSAWHHPAVCFLSVALLLLVVARRLPFLTGYLVLFAFAIAADALLSGALSPVPVAWRTPFEVAFVIVGDWRYFILLERSGPSGLTSAGWLRSVLLAFVVPIATAAMILLFPPRFAEMRWIFFGYEIAFFVFASLLFLFWLPRRTQIERTAEGDFLRALTRFELLQYGLWLVADALLLVGQSWALVLRMTANVLYYGGFLPFVWWRAPERAPRESSILPAAAALAAGLAISFAGLLGKPFGTHSLKLVGSDEATLTFVEPGKGSTSLTLAAITAAIPVETVAAFDPYYERAKRWRAVPVEALMQKGFGRDLASLHSEEFVLRARDGYTMHVPGARLLEGGAYVAFTDLDAPTWEPIGPQRAHPGPYYLIWSRREQQDLRTHPRPWQLASFELASFDTTFAHVRPVGVAPNSPPDRGFQRFRERCLLCHAINKSGGHVGPDLNVPKNVLEYRSATEVRAYIKNPRALRYSNMPPHPDLSDRDLDELVAYFEVMKSQKYDEAPSDASGH